MKSKVGNPFSKLVTSSYEILLEKENISLLEHILERETGKLCTFKELKQVCKGRKRYSQEELSQMLSGAKKYVDGLLGIECGSPEIRHFSLFDRNITSYALISFYCMAGACIAFTAGIATFNPNAGLVMALPTALVALSSYGLHRKIKFRSEYSTFNNKIILEPSSKFTVRSSIAHEYVHYALFQHNIFDTSVDEGFARNIERLYAEQIAIAENDDRYISESAWNSSIAMNNAYKWACRKTGRKRKLFRLLENRLLLENNSYIIGTALFRLMEEREGKDAYRNFMAAYKFSESLLAFKPPE